MPGMPPPRYRVIERDRRLEVVDTWANGARPDPVSRPGAKLPDRPATNLPVQTKFDGSATLRTLALYDDKGPREVRLEPGARATIRNGAIVLVLALAVTAFISPIFLVATLVILARSFKPIRARITEWLDRRS